jgi:hypothetical protein
MRMADHDYGCQCSQIVEVHDGQVISKKNTKKLLKGLEKMNYNICNEGIKDLPLKAKLKHYAVMFIARIKLYWTTKGEIK